MTTLEKMRSLQFPIYGLDTSKPLFDQRPGTCPQAINVRAYDSVTDRQRGGSRGGLNPFFGAGSVAQVSGANRIQSLSCVVTASQGATFENATYGSLSLKLDYSESDSPPPRNAPTLTFPEVWYQNSNGASFTGVTGVIVGTPDGGGTGKGTATFKATTDGTTVTLVATFVSAGFPGPYFYSGPGQVQTLTQTNVNFFNPAVSKIAGQWTVVAGSFIGNYEFDFFYTGP